jgi:hypothetical protein
MNDACVHVVINRINTSYSYSSSSTTVEYLDCSVVGDAVQYLLVCVLNGILYSSVAIRIYR